MNIRAFRLFFLHPIVWLSFPLHLTETAAAIKHGAAVSYAKKYKDLFKSYPTWVVKKIGSVMCEI